jgi:non-homologous end joining protein Ku
MKPAKTVNLGVRIPPEILERADRWKGYHSRNKFLVKLVDEALTRLEEESQQEERIRSSEKKK